MDDGYGPGDIRRGMPRFMAPLLAGNLQLAARFAALAEDAGCTPAQLALGWLLAQGERIVPIPGTRDVAHLHENLAAATMVFDDAVLAAAGALLPPNAFSGPRYNAAMQAQIDTELLPGESLQAASATSFSPT